MSIRVMICVPVYKPYVPKLFAKHKNDPTPLPHGLLHPATRRSISDTMQRWKSDIRFGIAQVRECACLEQARGGLYGQYRGTGRADYLWMIDGDVSWQPEALGQLLDRDLPLVGAAYPIKEEGVEESKRSATRFRPDREIDETGLVEAEYLNGGFMLIKDELLRAMDEFYPELRYVMNPPSEPYETYGLWHPTIVPYPPWVLEMHPELGDGAHESISEDWAFCYRARELGAKSMNDCNVQLGHWEGKKQYQLPRMAA